MERCETFHYCYPGDVGKNCSCWALAANLSRENSANWLSNSIDLPDQDVFWEKASDIFDRFAQAEDWIIILLRSILVHATL